MTRSVKWTVLLLFSLFGAVIGVYSMHPGATPAVAESKDKKYVGDQTCKECHSKQHQGFLKTSHAKAFKSLSDYPLVEPVESIEVINTILKDFPYSYRFDLKSDLIKGVMMDHYLIAEAPKEANFYGSRNNPYFIVASLHPEAEGKWSLRPAIQGDFNSDGMTDWGAFSYTCIDCHSPGLKQNEPDLRSGISCESCHGPGADHVAAKEKKGTISASSEACLNCHGEGKPQEVNGKLVAQNHYGPRFFKASKHAQDETMQDCTVCHTAHRANAEGHLLKANSAEALCAKCHTDEINLDEIMWKNPTDARGHFVRDHSFGAIRYDDLGDNPDTKPVEITNPDVIEKLKQAYPELKKEK
ncbi:hypothetical protein GTO91_04180 [Heliobacterium undosum]|uniref:Uncharacterized protein n=1 Tax=Heliomicrobium undosum TaxID=121734 RepID=A0A845L045_9FIRM|nr:multiheme c-type cytochrome [Heliomicrobium undosum]MZP28906.1 hypothetical protein [Heliomicrobium undosum]